jgi:hypothetical protein
MDMVCRDMAVQGLEEMDPAYMDSTGRDVTKP